ncbi:MAG: hypothetical protein ACMXYE_04115 [Candidatus Woesearchaeota archaeon]
MSSKKTLKKIKVFKVLFANKFRIILFATIILSLILLFSKYKPFFVGTVFLVCIICAQLAVFLMPLLGYIGFETGYFFTMMMGYLYGPEAGFYFAFFFLALHIIEQAMYGLSPLDISMKVIVVPLMGYTAGFVPEGGIYVFGTVVITLLSILIFVINLFFWGEDMVTMVLWCAGLVFINSLLFQLIAPIIITVT